MPRTPEQYSSTPFATVLTRYMWSKTPPWTTPKLAAVLGIARTRVGNWLYKDIVPEIDTMLAILARLNIPIADLLGAYAAQGKPVPPLTSSEAGQRAATQAPQQYAVPSGRKGRQPAAPAAPATLTDPSAPSVARVARVARVASGEPEVGVSSGEGDDAADEWDRMLAHTRQVMTLAGMPSAAIEAMLADIADRRAGQPSSAERRRAEEHQPPQQSQQSQQSQGRGDSNPSQRDTPTRGGLR